MCRMLGVVAPRPVRLDALLCDVGTSLAALSQEHGDGWGIAATGDGGWAVARGTRRAADCPAFEAVARGTLTRIGIAHVRKRTVGPISIDNTHPFVRGELVLAHNGTVKDPTWLERRASRARLSEVRGQTDSERLFAFVLTEIDAHGSVRDGLASATRALRSSPCSGTASFLLSDGQSLFAFRLGRALYALERGAGASAGRRARASLIASQPLTGEAWRELEDGALVEVGAVAESQHAA